LQKLGALLPHPVQAAGWRELPALLTELADEVDRRQKLNDADYPSLFILVHGLQRFRDLRKGEDDFGFGRRDEGPAKPAQQFATVLREGSAVGVHLLIWCDGLTNLHRSLERQALRDFEMRVLFQMSVTDSSTLIDSPAASKLGMHRALFHSEDHALPEKFRPYGLPADAWLAEFKQRLLAKKVVGRAAAKV
jgi:hypothetical protein